MLKYLGFRCKNVKILYLSSSFNVNFNWSVVYVHKKYIDCTTSHNTLPEAQKPQVTWSLLFLPCLRVIVILTSITVDQFWLFWNHSVWHLVFGLFFLVLYLKVCRTVVCWFSLLSGVLFYKYMVDLANPVRFKKKKDKPNYIKISWKRKKKIN